MNGLFKSMGVPAQSFGQTQPPERPMQQNRGLFGMDKQQLLNLMTATGASLATRNPGAFGQTLMGLQQQQKGKQSQRAMSNMTAKWLRTQGRTDLADAVDSGQIDGKSAMEFYKGTKAEKPAYRKGADGYLYNMTTGKRALPGVVAKEQEGAFVDEDTGQLVFRGKATKGQTELDKKYAADMNEFITGGASDAAKNLAQLKEARKRLDSGENLTGPVIGSLPDAVTSFTNPNVIDTREAVEEVVQRNLREVLGAQFTQKEGERLIARAYNPKLPEKMNKDRLDRLIKQIELAYQSKAEAAEYFRKNGTLQGWNGKLPSLEDFNVTADEPSKSSVQSYQEYFK